LFISCHQKSSEGAGNRAVATTTIKKEIPPYSPEMVVNKKDLVCGMPVTAGIEDTTHFNGKAYGFCSKECKEEFLKKPRVYIAAAK
jgi:YHS domain-containing protein